MKHLELDIEVSFERREIAGTVVHHLHEPAASTETVTLHTRDLTIDAVRVGTDEDMHDSGFELGARDAIEGTPLVVEVPIGCDRVAVRYRSAPNASALQWLDPRQTAGKEHPYLYTQGQSNHTRSWIPCVDDPALRITYDATVRVPRPLRAIMAAEETSVDATSGVYRFHMPQPIPTYLIALAVGELEFRPLGPRSGVWSEPSEVDRAAAELDDTETMIGATEKLFGPYRWGRYDILILPPSFPLGGMENPRLTFATPTILAGDKSLVSLVAHELAHSWSGNLVTNATWNDFWLNEGFTVYIERRIQEAVYGRDRSEMEALIGRDHLQDTLDELGADSRDTWLVLDLSGRDPDDALTNIPYEKGYLFLRLLEERFGRERFDTFLRDYFDENAFRSMTSADFVRILDEELFAKDPGIAAEIDVQAWVFGPGLPPDAPQATSDAFDKVAVLADAWLDGDATLNEQSVQNWTAQEWIHFLRCLPRDLAVERVGELDAVFALSNSHNSEVLCEWLLLSVTSGYEVGLAKVRGFLLEVGRKKFLQPIYQEMMAVPALREQAIAIYGEARGGYHPMAQTGLDKVMKPSAESQRTSDNF